MKEDDLVKEIDIESGSFEENALHICTKEGRTIASSECAICIDSYKVNDSVVWSRNTSCPHVFHSACIEPWLCANKDNCCPSCRQNFIENTNNREQIAHISS